MQLKGDSHLHMKSYKNRTILSFILGLGLFSMPQLAQASDELDRRVEATGSVRVMVRLALPEAPAKASAADRAKERRERIARARERVASPLRKRGAGGVVRSFSEVPWVAVEVDAEGLADLRESADVKSLRLDRRERVQLRESSEIVGASAVHRRGVAGRGWAIGILDTGVEAAHPFLAGRVRSGACFSADASCPNGETTMIGPGAGEPCDFGESSCGHGTHVAGIAAGQGRSTAGVAPAAEIIPVQIFTEFTGEDCEDMDEDPCALAYLSDITSGLEYLYSMRNEIRIAAVNLSIGGELYSSVSECEDADPRTEIVGLLRAAGIAVVAAAGNESSIDSLTTPGCLSDVISVSSTNDMDEISSFSNTTDFLDFFAPGAQIVSSVPGGNYSSIWGSSQAAPHVAGAYALLFEALGQSSLELSSEMLRASGQPISVSNLRQDIPRLQIDRALDLLELDRRGTGLQRTPDGERILLSKDLAGERWAIVLNVGDGSVSGNVFLEDGSDPAFVSCIASGDGSSDGYLSFACAGASQCQSGCQSEDWTSLGPVTLPESFFSPRPRYPLPQPLVQAGGRASDSQAGVREIPGQERVLVSKDAGGKRWAIAWNEDGTVTGNVYDPEGGAPQFVWCSDLGNDGNPDLAARVFRFRCAGSDPCFEGSCRAENWTDLGAVELPGSFFQP
jgi:subtilisin family serine protease